MIANLESLESALFPVELRPVFYRNAGGDYVQTDEVKLVWNGRDDAPISYAGKDYVPVPYQNVIDMVSKRVDDLGLEAEVRQSYLSKGGGKFSFVLSFPELDYTPPDGHRIRYEQRFRSSLDGSTDNAFDHGALRMVCLNGMIVRSSLGHYRTKHVGAVLGRLTKMIDEMTSALSMGPDLIQSEVMKYAGAQIPKVLTLRNEALKRYDADETARARCAEFFHVERTDGSVQLSGSRHKVSSEFLRNVGAASVLAAKYVEPMVLMTEERDPETLWDLYNIVTDVLSHNVPSWQVQDRGLRGMHHQLESAQVQYKRNKAAALEVVN